MGLHLLEQKAFPQAQPKKCKHGHVKTLNKSGNFVCLVCRRRNNARLRDKKTEEKLAKQQEHYKPDATLYAQLKQLEWVYNREHHSED